MSKFKTALLLTSPAGKISQEVALIDKLREKKGLLLSEGDTYLAGFAGGALNIAAINACFRKNNPLPWDCFYKENFLTNMANDKVFIKTHPVYWDTLPLRRTLYEFLSKAKFDQLYELPFYSNILTFSHDAMNTVWVNSTNPRNANVELSDLLMASMAIPVIFPSQPINAANELPTGLHEGSYIDGGSAGVFRKYKRNIKKAVAECGAFDTLYVLSPAREDHIGFSFNKRFDEVTQEEVHVMADYEEQISMKGFLKFLGKLKKANRGGRIANQIFVSIPDLKSSFDILDFGNQIKKYDAVCDWVEKNPANLAIELDEYLSSFRL